MLNKGNILYDLFPTAQVELNIIQKEGIKITFDLKINEKQIKNINAIAKFLARRDLDEMSTTFLQDNCGQSKVDLLILLGNSIPCTAEKAAEIFHQGLADRLMIAGGRGHSTKYLRENIKKQQRYQEIKTAGRAEADIFYDVIKQYLYDQKEDNRRKGRFLNEETVLIENKSTNCGDNARQALKIVRKHKLSLHTVLLIQDPTMQLRTDASFRREWRQMSAVTFINFAPFIPRVAGNDRDSFFYVNNNKGLWSRQRFLSLILGEVPRLRDDENGYGPRGQDYIAHVDIPEKISEAHQSLKNEFPQYLR